MPRSVFLLGWIFLTADHADAQQPTPVLSYADVDRIVYDTLRDLHNRGGDLYNQGDPNGAYRYYQSALAGMRPFLGHRPLVQAMIDKESAEIEKLPLISQRAFKLHELIEKVREGVKPRRIARPETFAPPVPKPEPERLPPPTIEK